MQRSFVAKTTVNFPDHELYVRVGDTLVYNAANDNSLTVYRAGAIIKTIKTTPISIAAMTKTKMIVEMGTTVSKPAVKTPPASSPATKAVSKPKSTSKKITINPALTAGGIVKLTKEDQPVSTDKPKVVPKSKSEAKRVACLKGEDMQAAVEKFVEDHPVLATPLVLPEESNEKTS